MVGAPEDTQGFYLKNETHLLLIDHISLRESYLNKLNFNYSCGDGSWTPLVNTNLTNSGTDLTLIFFITLAR